MLYRTEDDGVFNDALGTVTYPAKHPHIQAWLATLPHVSELGKAMEKSPEDQDHFDAVRDVMRHLGLPFDKNNEYEDDARDIIAAIESLKTKSPASLVERAREYIVWLDDPKTDWKRSPEQPLGILRDLAALSGDAVETKVEACPIPANELRDPPQMTLGAVRMLASWALRVGGGE